MSSTDTEKTDNSQLIEELSVLSLSSLVREDEDLRAVANSTYRPHTVDIQGASLEERHKAAERNFEIQDKKDARLANELADQKVIRAYAHDNAKIVFRTWQAEDDKAQTEPDRLEQILEAHNIQFERISIEEKAELGLQGGAEKKQLLAVDAEDLHMFLDSEDVTRLLHEETRELSATRREKVEVLKDFCTETVEIQSVKTPGSSVVDGELIKAYREAVASK